MANKKNNAPATPATDTWQGEVIENRRQDNHVSLALNLDSAAIAALGLNHGDRLAVSAGGQRQEVVFHGWMRAWAMQRRFFGDAAAAALAVDPGVDAYRETDDMLGATTVPGHAEWLRLRLAISHRGAEPAFFSVPAGTAAEVSVIARAPSVLPVAAARFKQGVLQATVLASHERALTLNVAFPALRKLQGTLDDWYTLELAGLTLPIHHARGILPADYETFYRAPEALLFDLESHWADEDTKVMVLRPMQTNWPGRFPDFESVLLPVMATPGTPALLRGPVPAPST